MVGAPKKYTNIQSYLGEVIAARNNKISNFQTDYYRSFESVQGMYFLLFSFTTVSVHLYQFFIHKPVALIKVPSRLVGFG